MSGSSIDAMINNILITKELPWMKSTSMSRKGNVKKVRTSSKTPHQFILDSIDFIDDQYWKDKLEQIAYHKYPKGFILKGYILSFKKNMNSIYSVNLEGLSSEEVCQKVIEFLQEHGNMKSAIDRENDRIISEEMKNRDEDVKEWKNLRSVKKQNIFLMNYAIELCKDKEIDYNDLFCLLSAEVMLKNITSEDIVISDNKIVKIHGLEYRDGKYVVNSKNELKRSKIKNETPLNTKLMANKPISVSKSWDSILSSLNTKKVETKSNRQLIAETLSEIERSSAVSE